MTSTLFRLRTPWILAALLLAAASLIMAAHENVSVAKPSLREDQDRARAQIVPRLITTAVRFDSDDPAIWIDREDPSRSLILGTDKGGDGQRIGSASGALYAFDLKGQPLDERRVRNLVRPNNVDVEYDLAIPDGGVVDIAVVAERDSGYLRVYQLPELLPIDGGRTIRPFEDLAARPMGVGIYRRPSDGSIYVVVSRKTGPKNALLGWVRLTMDEEGAVQGRRVATAGEWGGGEEDEVESLLVDDEMGVVFYSDEARGVRKILADPEASGFGESLALFATDGFVEDREGLSLISTGERSGYLMVSDQAAGKFQVFNRCGPRDNPHDHSRIAILDLSTVESDGSDATSVSLPGFEKGLFVAMSDDRTFHYYGWEDLLQSIVDSSE